MKTINNIKWWLKKYLPNMVWANLSELARLNPFQQFDDIDVQPNPFVHACKGKLIDVECHNF